MRPFLGAAVDWLDRKGVADAASVNASEHKMDPMWATNNSENGKRLSI